MIVKVRPSVSDKLSDFLTDKKTPAGHWTGRTIMKKNTLQQFCNSKSEIANYLKEFIRNNATGDLKAIANAKSSHIDVAFRVIQKMSKIKLLSQDIQKITIKH